MRMGRIEHTHTFAIYGQEKQTNTAQSQRFHARECIIYLLNNVIHVINKSVTCRCQMDVCKFNLFHSILKKKCCRLFALAFSLTFSLFLFLFLQCSLSGRCQARACVEWATECHRRRRRRNFSHSDSFRCNALATNDHRKNCSIDDCITYFIRTI